MADYTAIVTGGDVLYSALLMLSAFWLGACPFSVWLGRWFLNKEITGYGDGNPGAANVFRAGDIKTGSAALLLDIAKGAPFVFIAHSLLELPELAVMLVGLCAILGHAFSPILRFRGGKAIAVTFGVLIGTAQPEMLFPFTIFTVLGFLFIKPDAWTVMLGPIGTLIYLAITTGASWASLFMICILLIFVVKQYEQLKVMPRFKVKLINWLHLRKRV